MANQKNRVEAEEMNLLNYRLESSEYASGNSLISFQGGKSNEIGTAFFEFIETSGYYDLTLAYFDENDGQASLEVALDGKILDQWQLDQDLGSNRDSGNNLVQRQVATNLYLESGTVLEIRAKENQWEHARVDYLDLTPVEPPETTPVAGDEMNMGNQKNKIGTNLNGINDWSSQLPFLDGFRSSRPWIPQKPGVWNTRENDQLDLDANGWVKSLPSPEDGTEYTHVGTLLYRGLAGNYPGGEYLVLYEGEGTIEYDFDATLDLAASGPGRDVITVNPSDLGIYLRITETDPNQTGNYLRNLRVVPPAWEDSYQTEIFNSAFIEKIQPFSAFRFGQWMKTADSKQKEWSARPTLEDATWSQAGAPVEVMVELANRTDSDPWFTLPHQATDEYVLNFATYVRDHLDPDLKVYVEYSNEVWNPQFEQAQWVQQQAKQEWGEGSYRKGLEWFGKRTTEITQIWDEVFGADQERVIGVMGAQAANPWTAQTALNYEAWAEQPLSHAEYGIDAIAIAPYFGSYLGQPKYEAEVESWTAQADGGLGKLFDELTQGGIVPDGPGGGALQQAYQNMQTYVELAEQEQLSLLAYEGGQHLVGRGGVENNQAITNLFIEANRDPRMGEIYREYLSQWQALGGDLFMNFSDIVQASMWGSWGALEYVNRESSPKYEALLDVITNRESFPEKE